MRQDQRKEHLLDKVLGRDQRIKVKEEILKNTKVKASDVQRACKFTKTKRTTI